MDKQKLIESITDLPSDFSRQRPMIDKLTALELIKLLDEPEAGHADEAPRYVKNILARLRELPLHDREVWLIAIMGEFEQDFSHAKWREGYEQGKLEGAWVGNQLKDADKIRQELNKVLLPSFMDDWIFKCQLLNDFSLNFCSNRYIITIENGVLNMKTTTSLRLKQILSERNLRQVDILNSSLPLQKELGIKMGKSALSQYVSGKSSPDQDKLVLLSKTLGVSEAWLMGYNVPMSDDTPVQELKIPTSPLVQKITEKAVKLTAPRKQKVLDFIENQLREQSNKVISLEEDLFEYKVYEKLSAGTGFSYFNDGNYDTVFYDKDLDHDFASWVFGDSMEPKYMNGEVVLIKETGFDYDGAVYAVDWDGQTYIKKVYKEKDGLRLVSINNKYKDKFAPYEEDPRIIGKIVGNFMPIEN